MALSKFFGFSIFIWLPIEYQYITPGQRIFNKNEEST